MAEQFDASTGRGGSRDLPCLDSQHVFGRTFNKKCLEGESAPCTTDIVTRSWAKLPSCIAFHAGKKFNEGHGFERRHTHRELPDMMSASEGVKES